ncbi:DUF3987 domain-containing protein [uncultured Porticoccus sp.]|uniref:DUF3987 domain-containing protein n=1 Tax=uncultured Porticoccus sp. TaxID=1256050 RepID=UPI0030D8550F|tara:strand:- start:8190 stop:10571 length:2382 start_codon:yes stop_codon:yes gene_type:complete
MIQGQCIDVPDGGSKMVSCRSISDGYHIFPLAFGTKAPTKGSTGFRDALPAKEAVKKWPDILAGNVGLYPGASGLLVIDVDIKNGAVGDKTLDELQAKFGTLPETFTVNTPSGGWHLYFKKPGTEHIGNNSIGKGIDIRCDAGYVVTAGSRIGDKAYVVSEDIPVAELPEKWVRLLTPLPKPSFFATVDKAKVELALKSIPPDVPYDVWVRVLAALHSEGLEELAHSWSSNDPRYTPQEVSRKWASFDHNKLGNITISTLFHLAKVYSNTDSWSKPSPLPSGLTPVEKYSNDLLPEMLGDFVDDIAERMQCPPDFPAVSILISLSTVIGRRCGIYPKRKDDWLVVPNLWGVVVGRPSLMKSPAIQQAMRSLDALITKSAQQHAAEMALFEVLAEAHAGQKEAWKKEVRKAGSDGKPTEDMLPPQKPEPPVEHRLRTNSGSVECLIKLLNENPNGLLVFRDELTGWLKSLDKPGKEGDRQFYLEAWNGNGASFDYDTFAHGHLHSDGLCLSMLGSIQPGPLSTLIAGAAKGGGGDDGMIQRFQLMVYPDSIGKWRNVDRPPNTDAQKKVDCIFQKLDSMTFPSVNGNIFALHFDSAAQDFFDNWRAALELKVQNEKTPTIESHLAKYRSLMPSIALLIHLADLADRNATLTPVTLEAATCAAALCNYLESHARRIYGMQAVFEVDGAKFLLQKLKEGDLDSPFTVRQVHRKHWSGLATAQEAEAACALLVDHGYLKEVEIRGKGRPTVQYLLNPMVLDGGDTAAVSKKSFDTFGTASPTPPTEKKVKALPVSFM